MLLKRITRFINRRRSRKDPGVHLVMWESELRAMAKSKRVRGLVPQHAKADSKLAAALLRAGGDIDAGKTIMLDYINVIVRFEKLGEATGLRRIGTSGCRIT